MSCYVNSLLFSFITFLSIHGCHLRNSERGKFILKNHYFCVISLTREGKKVGVEIFSGYKCLSKRMICVLLVQGWWQDGSISWEEDSWAGDGAPAPSAEHWHPRHFTAYSPDCSTGGWQKRTWKCQGISREIYQSLSIYLAIYPLNEMTETRQDIFSCPVIPLLCGRGYTYNLSPSNNNYLCSSCL